MGTSGNNFLQVVAKNFDVLALPLVTLVYPLYASIKAIETRSGTDDQQWFTYWVLYSLIILFELTFAKLLELLPIWPYAKLILSCWLVLPHFNGAAHVYRHCIRPFYMNPQMLQFPGASEMWYVPRKNIFSKQDDVLTAAERYMEEHGTEAFERLISKADREARARRNGNYMIFDDDYSFEDGLKLVKLRGEAMQDASDAARSAMVSVIRLDSEKVQQLCDAANQEVPEAEKVQTANYLCPGSYAL